nr:30S ribosomal protein S20 [Bacilli bacterium]
MPNIKSAIKRVLVTKTRSVRNAAQKSTLRTMLKKFESALQQRDMETAHAALRVAVRSLDKAATKGIIHRNQASRKKSRLTKRYNKAAM